ncbi:hypothetical protein OESDEN_19040 [Oesophagostomum dentatum]|uniref:Uncharacterized protein n=1 Tax=Oesophagostomum dentatum TaxID=61180 RepID=A0A0B1S8L4_OESDE|nr:hypothetical protein OESDEN_19040 [Oesophagostomum dentatum]
MGYQLNSSHNISFEPAQPGGGRRTAQVPKCACFDGDGFAYKSRATDLRRIDINLEVLKAATLP